MGKISTIISFEKTDYKKPVYTGLKTENKKPDSF